MVCPHCSQAFEMEAAGYADIVGQIKSAEFEAELNERLKDASDKHLLQVELAKKQVLSEREEEISIDLSEEKIIYGNSEVNFKIDPFKKKCLLEGLDDIALSLKKTDKIQTFENNLKGKKPWIFND